MCLENYRLFGSREEQPEVNGDGQVGKAQEDRGPYATNESEIFPEQVFPNLDAHYKDQRSFLNRNFLSLIPDL